MEIIRTKRQQRQDEKDSAVIAEYKKLLKEYPTVKVWRIFTTIGDNHGMTPEGVRGILVRRGVYQPIKCN